MRLVVTAGDVVVAQGMVKLAIVDQVDSARSVPNLVGVLPIRLLVQNVGVGVFEIDGLLGFF